MTEKPTVKIEVEPELKVKLKAVGGSEWNERLLNLTIRALPVDQKNSETGSDVGSAVVAGLVAMQPADPIEGMLMSQLVVVNEAALKMYRLAWLNNAEYFEASTKYLQLADKASRTVAILTERLDQHRGRGQPQIVVKHVTVNADQAVVTDTVVTDKAVPSPALLTDAAEKPMPTLAETSKFELVGGGKKIKSINPMQRAHAAPRCAAKSKRTGKPCRAPAVRGFRVCRMHGAGGGAPTGKRNGNYRHGARSKETVELWKLIKSVL